MPNETGKPRRAIGSGERRLRQRAFEAMAREVAANGYAETSVADVLRRAAMSRRTFYTLFSGREECFLAAYDAMRDAALDRLASSAPVPPERWREHTEAALGAMLQLLAERPESARLLVVDPPSVGPPGVERHERTMHAIASLVAHSHPDLPPDAVAAEAAVGAVHRVVQARIVAGRADELPGLAADLTALVEHVAAGTAGPL